MVDLGGILRPFMACKDIGKEPGVTMSIGDSV
jgi:hypothetical protein